MFSQEDFEGVLNTTTFENFPDLTFIHVFMQRPDNSGVSMTSWDTRRFYRIVLY